MLLLSFGLPTCGSRPGANEMVNRESWCEGDGQFWPLRQFMREVKEEVNPCEPGVWRGPDGRAMDREVGA